MQLKQLEASNEEAVKISKYFTASSCNARSMSSNLDCAAFAAFLACFFEDVACDPEGVAVEVVASWDTVGAACVEGGGALDGVAVLDFFFFY